MVAVVLLAGCAEPGPSQAPTPAVVVVERPVDWAFHLEPAQVCDANLVCVDGTDVDEDGQRIALGHNETATHVRLVLTSTDELPAGEEAVVQLDCDPLDPLTPPCGLLASARGALPLTLDQPIASPEGAMLRVVAYIDTDRRDTQPANAENGNVAGSLTLRRSARQPPPLVTVEEPLSFRGATAPCAFGVEAECDYPGGTTLIRGPYDRLTGLDIVVSWNAVASMTEELTVTATCSSPLGPGQPCAGSPEPRVAQGRSPLNLTDLSLGFPPGSRLEIEVTPGSTGLPVFPVPYPVRQEYLLEGHLLRLEPADAANPA